MSCVAHLMPVVVRLTPFVAHLMLVMVPNLPEQCSFQDLLFHLLFKLKSAEKSASRIDISLNGWEAKWSFIRENKEKSEEPSWGTSDNGATTAPWQLCKVHTIRDPMTQGYRAGGACRSCGTIPRKSSRSPGPFLVVSHYNIPLFGPRS